MEEHCPGECCSLLKFASFYFVVYLSLSHLMPPLLVVVVHSSQGDSLTNQVQLCQIFYQFVYHLVTIFFKNTFSLSLFNDTISLSLLQKKNCCDHLHILVVPVWLEGLPFLILCTHSILQTFLCSCFKMFCIWGQKNCEIILSLRESVRSSEAFSIYFMILNVHFWHYDFFILSFLWFPFLSLFKITNPCQRA